MGEKWGDGLTLAHPAKSCLKVRAVHWKRRTKKHLFKTPDSRFPPGKGRWKFPEKEGRSDLPVPGSKTVFKLKLNYFVDI